MRALPKLFAILLVAPPIAAAQSLSDANLAVTPWLTGLDQPTGIRFTDPGAGFVIEKGGSVKHFQNGTVSTVLSLAVNSSSERGLLGIALDPQFATAAEKHVFLYYSAAGAGGAWTDNRLVRYTWNGTSLVSPQFLRSFGTSADGLATGPNHNGGPLAVGPDGKLYGVTGDLNRSGIEQNDRTATATAFTGGLYRLNTDGTPAGDNPFSGDFSQWYAYGVRNSFGLAFDPVTGNLWDTENGPGSYDEINLVGRGMNSGWSAIMGPDARDSQNAPGDLVMLPGAVYADPKFSFRTPIGITSITFLHGSAWGPGYDDAVLVGENNAARLWLFRLNAARDGFVLAGSLADGVLDTGDVFPAFGTGFSVTTDLQIGPDGAVYVASLGGDSVYRIAPVPEPGTWALLAAGLVCTVLTARRARTARGESTTRL